MKSRIKIRLIKQSQKNTNIFSWENIRVFLVGKSVKMSKIETAKKGTYFVEDDIAFYGI